jgi:hypothetical protein
MDGKENMRSRPRSLSLVRTGGRDAQIHKAFIKSISFLQSDIYYDTSFCSDGITVASQHLKDIISWQQFKSVFKAEAFRILSLIIQY